MTAIDDRLAQLERQQAAQTRALAELVQGRWTGDLPNAAAEIVALMGGTPPDGFAPGDFPKGQGE